MNTKIIKDEDLRRLEDAIRNLWMSNDENNKRTYDRICAWLDSLERQEIPEGLTVDLLVAADFVRNKNQSKAVADRLVEYFHILTNSGKGKT